MTSRIWFHGTSEADAGIILAHGFAPSTYFARALEDALEFGGEFVFWVTLEYEPVTEDNWQMCVGEAVSAENIVALKRYSIAPLHPSAPRGKAPTGSCPSFPSPTHPPPPPDPTAAAEREVIELAMAWSDALYSQDAAIELDDAIMRLRAAQGTT